MSEWKMVKLKDYVDSISKTYKFSNAPVVFLNTSDILEGKILHKNLSYPDSLPGQAKKSIQNGDILFSEIRPANKRYAFIDFDTENYVVSTKLMVLRAKGNINNKYLGQYLTSYETLNSLQSAAEDRSGSFPQITFDNIKDLDLFLPPLPEQQTIAEVLSSIDDKIDLLHRNNKTLEEMAETLFRKWFVEGAKEDWEEVTIGSLCKRITKGTTPTTLGKSFKDSGVNFIKAESIEDHGGFIKSKFAFIDQDTHNLLLRSQLEEGDVLYTIAGTIGRTAIVTKGILPANTNQAVAILKPDTEKISNLFLKYLMKSDIITEVLESKIVHAVQPNLSLGEISSTQLKMPAEDIMREFNTISESISLKINSNVNELTNLINLRDVLLPKLMSGQVRVHV